MRTLSEDYISEAQRLLAELDRMNFGIKSALWLYREDTDRWTLLLATPRVDKEGLRKAYEGLWALVNDLPTRPKLGPSEVTLVGTHDRLIERLRRMMRVDEPGQSARLTNINLNNEYIDDALVLRST